MRPSLGFLVLLVAVAAFAADEPISWDEADQHVGEEATVEGRVVDIHCSPLSCLLAFEPSFNRFTAVVQASSFNALPPDDLRARFQGKLVRVHGKIVNRDSKPEIVVETPDAIQLATAPGKRPSDHAAAPAQAQAEVMERMADVLARVEELTERMAAVQERMDALLAQMEQRESALAAAQAPPPAAPEPVRPAYETLRSLKRGMSRTDVERLVGTPEYVENGGNGWTTWYYGGGRSVSFDGRGHVQALVGF
jgi:hypothetical protein